MPIIKVVNEPYPTAEDLYRLLDYLKRGGELYGLGLDPEHACYQMCLVKQLWQKTDGRQCRHFIVSFSDSETIEIDEAVYYGYRIAGYYSGQYQIVFSLHLRTDHIHLHFVLNSVSHVNGKKYSGGLEDYLRFREYVQELMPQWRVGFEL